MKKPNLSVHPEDPDAKQWSADVLFTKWAASKESSGPGQRERLGPESADFYGLCWDSWVRWLTQPYTDAQGARHRARRASYRTATAADVDEFLENGIAGRIQSRKEDPAPVSPVTQMRYGSLLQRIYEFATNRGAISRNPARTRTVANRASEAPQDSAAATDPAGVGLVLNAVQWTAIRKALPPKPGTTLQDVRDRAILLLLMDVHMTPGEIRELQLENVTTQLEDPLNCTLSLDSGTRKSQTRVLHLARSTSEALNHWLAARRTLWEGVAGDPAARPREVFLTTRRTALNRQLLVHLVRTTMQKAFEGKFALPYHRGPQVLRNSRIVFRLNAGEEPSRVAADAGFKDNRSFRGLLIHLDPVILAQVEPKRNFTPQA